MDDLGTQILVGVLVTVISGLILGGIYKILGHYKEVLKEKWQELRFRISLFSLLSGFLMSSGITMLFFIAPIEIAAPITMVSVGIVMLIFLWIYSLINSVARTFSEPVKDVMYLKGIVKELYQLSSDIPSEIKEPDLKLVEILMKLEKWQNKESSIEKFLKEN